MLDIIDDGGFVAESVSDIDWTAVAATLGDTVHAAWPTPTYCLFRGDAGKGPARTLIPGIGAPWLVMCQHGKGVKRTKGADANAAAKNRAAWCEHCAAGAPASEALPRTGQAPVEAPVEAPAPAKSSRK